MYYRSFASMNIAIIGNGRINESLAIGLAASGHHVWVGSTKDAMAYNNFLYNFYDIQHVSIEEAATACDIIFIATEEDEVREVAYRIDDVKQKVVIDCTSFCEPTGPNSNTLSAIKAITGSQRIVKCYRCNGCDTFSSRLLKKDAMDIFLAGDDVRSKQIAKVMFDNLGFKECFDFGGEDMVPKLDAMTASWHNLGLDKIPGTDIQLALIRK